MREMKDSRIKWIGEIPGNWEINRLQFCLKEVNKKNNPIQTSQVLSLMKDVGVLPYEEKGDIGNKSKENICEYHLEYPDTIVLNCMNILIGSVGISKYFGCVSPVYYVFKETNICDLRFINYIFNTKEFQKELRRYAKGILEIRLRVAANDIFKQKIALPSKYEQTIIANFLDKKCDEIDSLTKDIQVQIEALKDYKKSIITEAVTKGLDPNVEMKDSGIEWIGEIPKNWDVKKIKNICGTRNIKYTPDKGNLDYFALENIVSWEMKHIATSNEYDIKDSCLCFKGDVVFGKLRPYLAKTYLVDYDRCCSSEFAIFCDFKGNNKYYLYTLTAKGFIDTVNNSTSGVKMPRANIEFIKNMQIPKPSDIEQNIIVNYLDDKCSQIDQIIEEKQQQLDTLAEYKKSIIYEYVTGKKEVSHE